MINIFIFPITTKHIKELEYTTPRREGTKSLICFKLAPYMVHGRAAHFDSKYYKLLYLNSLGVNHVFKSIYTLYFPATKNYKEQNNTP